LRPGLCPAIRQNHGCNTLLYYRSLVAQASAKFANAFLTPATIVLSDYTRSWSVDRETLIMY